MIKKLEDSFVVLNRKKDLKILSITLLKKPEKTLITKITAFIKI